MFRLKVISNLYYLRVLSKRSISNEFRKVLDTRLENPTNIKSTALQLSGISKNVNAFNLDLLLNNISQHDENRSQVLDLLITLRGSKLTQDTLDSTHFAAVRYLLDNVTIQELLTIVTDRQKYGIFLDNFTAFAVLEEARQKNELIVALPLTLKLIQYDEVDNSYTRIYCIKSCLVALKEEMDKQPDSSEENEEKSSEPERKVRVKFLRNPLIIDQHIEWSRALLKICSKLPEDDIIKHNAYILGISLSKCYDTLSKQIATISKEYKLFEDVIALCLEFLKRQNQVELVTQFQNFTSSLATQGTFNSHLDNKLKTLADTEEPQLIKDQAALFSKWQLQRDELKRRLDKEVEEKERKAKVEQIMKDIKEKEQHLWFFEKEEDIDLEIENKKVYYPKRWFGKKKKPRKVDEDYVPPEIRRIG